MDVQWAINVERIVPRASVMIDDPQPPTGNCSAYRRALEHLGSERGHDLSELELERIAATIGIIPPDVATVLDVGCGDGRILQRLPKGLRAIGLDYSHSSVSSLPRGGVCASLEKLPFPDRSFDLLLCCEVLEHLPEQTFERALHELGRVARKYILVSVPYKEDLRLHRTRCSGCGAIFHVWGHVRRFTDRGLDALFDAFVVGSTRFVGKRSPYYLPIVLRLNQRYGNRWADWERTSMCPRCGSTAFRRPPRNAVTIACGVINRLTSWAVPVSQNNWVLKCYVRRA